MKATEIDAFRQVLAQLEALHQEMANAAKKSPDKAVSAVKVRFVNVILSEAAKVLGRSKPNIGFDQFELDDLPSASDVSFVAA